MSRNLFLEADEDITSAIDKLGQIEDKQIRVVVPKRSNLLASMINLKLLKKAAADAHKDLVIVTGDQTVIGLAGRAGLKVAENVKADAAVPEMPSPTSDAGSSEVIEESEEAEATPSVPTSTEPPSSEAQDTSSNKSPDLSDSKHQPHDKAPVAAKTRSDEDGLRPSKAPKGKIPDFNRFQKRLLKVAIAGLILLVLFGLNFFFKKADITIFARGTRIPVELSFDTTDNGGDPATGVVGSRTLRLSRSLSGTYPATGEKDAGTKATGSVTVTNYCYNPGTLPSGTALTAANGRRFVSREAVAVPNAVPAGGTCPSPTTATVPVEASENGDAYNLAPTTYTVGNIPSSGNNNSVRGQGEQMSGGTTRIVTVVSQADIRSARNRLLEDEDDIKKELFDQAGDSMLAVESTFAAEVSGQSPNPGPGSEADSFNLTLEVTYTAQALSRDDLEELIKLDAESKIGEENQVYDTGLQAAEITPAENEGRFNLLSRIYAGARIDTDEIKQEIKGAKRGAALTQISDLPGVDRVDIGLSPFWVSRMPRLLSRIDIDIRVEDLSQ